MDSLIDLDIDLYDLIPAIVLGAVESTQTPKNPSQSGREYLHHLLHSSERRIYTVLRMQKDTFLELCAWLRKNTDLREGRSISIEEKVAMFLWTLNYNSSNRSVGDQFKHSGESVSR
jgi:hypothetical protein